MTTFSFPFVGAKNADYFQKFAPYLPEKCTHLYEPFTGSATFTFQAIAHYGKTPAIRWAEADPAMRSLWKTWGDDTVPWLIEGWKERLLLAHLQALIVISDLSARLAIGGKSERWAGTEWNYTYWTGADLILRLFLRLVRDRLYLVLNNHAAHSDQEIAAAYAVFKRFCHGSVMRTNSSGGLNVSLSVDKCRVPAIARWTLTYPAESRPEFKLFNSAQQLQYEQFRSFKNGAIALIDSPYYCDRTLYRQITACYPGHKPHDRETLMLCVDALKAALKAKVGTIIVTNYYCPELDFLIVERCLRYGRKVEAIENGSLKKLVSGSGNAKSGKRTVKNKKPEPIEWIWIIRKDVEQLSIFDVEAVAGSDRASLIADPS